MRKHVMARGHGSNLPPLHPSEDGLPCASYRPISPDTYLFGLYHWTREKPFALLVHYREPHAPYGPMPDEDEARTQNLKPAIPDQPNLQDNTQKLMRDYLTAVSAIDRNPGRILKALKDQGLDKNTIVVFTSDHGYNIGHHGLRFKGNAYWITKGKSGCRPNMFETSIQVPLLVRWPGVTKPGSKIDAMTANIDLFASFLSMVGVKHETLHHGWDFSPYLRGETPKQWRDDVFGQYQMVNDSKHSMRMIRTVEWKLIRHYRVQGEDELYHLKSDPTEAHNLIDDAKHATVVTDLQRRMDAHMKHIGDTHAEQASPQAK